MTKLDAILVARALRRHPTTERPFRDILEGAGCAFDPIPLSKWDEFCRRDLEAFWSDHIKLSFDRDTAEAKFRPSVKRFVKSATPSQKFYNGKTADTWEKSR